jgi:hypothetical protein
VALGLRREDFTGEFDFVYILSWQGSWAWITRLQLKTGQGVRLLLSL